MKAECRFVKSARWPNTWKTSYITLKKDLKAKLYSTKMNSIKAIANTFVWLLFCLIVTQVVGKVNNKLVTRDCIISFFLQSDMSKNE